MVADEGPEIELISAAISDETSDGDAPPDQETPQSTGLRHGERRWVPLLALAILVGAVGMLAALDTGEQQPSEAEQAENDDAPAGGSDQAADGRSERLDAVQAAQSIPRPLLLAELYAADPSASGLRDLFEAIGGFDGLTLGTAEGAFDLVRFDPVDPGRLLATHRSSYGSAENQRLNELWLLNAEQRVEQTLWAPSESHDFAHFNVDGTVTMWVHGGGTEGFAPRVAVVLNNNLNDNLNNNSDWDLTPISITEPVYGSRFSSTGGTVFALTGNGDYYSNDDSYVDLVADDGSGPVVLADGADFGWIDNPVPEILVAYPIDETGSTAVWDAVTLEPLPDHPLAGRNHLRVAVSADGAVAVAVTVEGGLEAIDLGTGATTARFGSVDVDGIDQPISVNSDGSIAITVERTGHVTLWWVGDDRPIASIEAHAAQPRWVAAAYGAISASAVAPDASRVALRSGARSGKPISWMIVDTDPDSWIRRACAQSDRSLSQNEVAALGLPDGPKACQAR